MKKLILLLFLAFSMPLWGQAAGDPVVDDGGFVPAAGGSITIVNSAFGSAFNNSASNISTSALSVTGGNRLIAQCAYKNGSNITATTTFTDTAGNTFTQIAGATAFDSGGLYQAVSFESLSVTGNASDVGTCNIGGGTGTTGEVYASMVQFNGGTGAHDTAALLDQGPGSGNITVFTTPSFSTANASAGISCILSTTQSTNISPVTAGGGFTLGATDLNNVMASENRTYSTQQTGVTASITTNLGTTGIFACDVIK